EESPSRATLTGLYRWQKIALGKHGSIEVLDARGADDAALELVREALRQQRPDLFFFLSAPHGARPTTQNELERLEKLLQWNGPGGRLLELQVADAPSVLKQQTSSPAICASLIGIFSLGNALRHRLVTELPNEARVELVRSVGDIPAQREIAELLVKST